MEIYSEEGAIQFHQDNERVASASEKEDKKREKKRKDLDDNLYKLNEICYAINSYRDMDENLIGRYNLDSIAEKSRQLAELIKKNPETFINKGVKFQDAIGNFHGGLAMLSHISPSAEKESRMKKIFEERTQKYNDFLNSELFPDNNH